VYILLFELTPNVFNANSASGTNKTRSACRCPINNDTSYHMATGLKNMKRLRSKPVNNLRMVVSPKIRAPRTIRRSQTRLGPCRLLSELCLARLFKMVKLDFFFLTQFTHSISKPKLFSIFYLNCRTLVFIHTINSHLCV